MMENTIKMDDLGVPQFLETSICTSCILCLLMSRPPCRRFASTVFRERVGIDTSEVCAAKLEMSSIGKALTSIVMGGKMVEIWSHFSICPFSGSVFK